MARRKRSEKKRILICTEGEITEVQYIESLMQILGSSGESAYPKTVPVGRDPEKIVRRCIQERDSAKIEFDRCVCLMDVDTHAKLPQALKLAQREGIDVVVSNLKFEVWLLWHVTKSVAHFESQRLDNLMKTHDVFARDKHLSSTFPVEKYSEACALARQVHADLGPNDVGPNPSTSMPWLIDILSGKNS